MEKLHSLIFKGFLSERYQNAKKEKAMKIRYLLSLSILSLLVSDLTAYTLSITKIGLGSGSLKINGTARALPFSHDYAAGFHLTVEAVADDGSHFRGWSGSGLYGTTNPVSFNMPAENIKATANFTLLLAPDIAIDPASWDFGLVNVGKHWGQKFIYSNWGNAALHVTAITITGANASEFSIPYGGEATTVGVTGYIVMDVQFSPTSAGNKSAVLSIASDDPDENPLNIDLIGTGLAPEVPDIDCNSTHLNWLAIVGKISGWQFIVYNEGNADLNVTDVTITGANASEFSIGMGGGAFTLAPSGFRYIFVYFTPTSVGSKSAAVSITSNDPDENPFNIDLIGTGIAPDIDCNPASWDYGLVKVGSRPLRSRAPMRQSSASRAGAGLSLWLQEPHKTSRCASARRQPAIKVLF
jgi:hypothetical protein